MLGRGKREKKNSGEANRESHVHAEISEISPLLVSLMGETQLRMKLLHRTQFYSASRFRGGG